MEVNLFIFLVIVVMALGFGATLWVGFSKANRDGDPGYDGKTASKWGRLILLYALTVVVVIVAFIVLLQR